MKKIGLIYFMITCYFSAFAQYPVVVYDNKVYQPNIKTIECYNSKKEQSLPLIALKSGETITLAFDDLKGGNKNYSYTIEHCTYDWKPSKINQLDYLESFKEDIIFNYRFSFNTLQKFTHYQLNLPNDQIKPKLAGNYLLKVYEGNNPQKIVITQRFYITNNAVNVGSEVVPSSQVEFRNSKQKINFTIFHPMPITNPFMDLKAIVMQNNDPQTAILNTKPTFVKQGSLVYNDINLNEFWAGNEYRKFDTRSFRYKGEHVQDFYRDTAINVILIADQPYGTARYSNQFDENGNFFIRNQDGRDNVTDSDYADVLFTLNANPPSSIGNAYVVGRFNNYILNEESKLNYEPTRKRFYQNIKLKQGLYDYKYVWVDENGKYNNTIFESSFFETENTYQIFIYYKRPGGRWDELVGFNSVNSLKK
ncbi:DUF5103 domain-containing protein [Pedobacter polaris]|uniref:DUF5103 domain-containing protein n=1 Tax=Pedobacter polaris TaxID=2571273 RepID=A0A4U1CXJ0_9SPHI|nr:DUF5103 domain-containing protein [Pedobacter polaris]TKC10868.1 DUF5103 domain-containing protein [Pedobacter polaris]